MNNNHPRESRVQEHRKQYKKIKRHRILRWFLGIIIALVLGVAAYASYVFFMTRGAFNQTFDPNNAVQIKNNEFNGKKPFAVLLMGTDTDALDRHEKLGNTDTMILAVVNPAEKKYTLMSIPRDTLAQMIGAKSFTADKINAAYPIGGARMAMDTVSNLLNVPIKYYVVINMGGLTRMVNGVGGVTVKPPLTFSFGGYKFKKGKKLHLNGDEALAYSRMRYQDPLGDYGRQQRQRQVIVSLIEHAASVKTLANLDSILNSLAHNVRTNLPFNSLANIARNYRSSAENSTSDYLHGKSVNIDGASYQVMPTKELQRVSDIVRTQLGLDPEIIDNNETYQNDRNIKAGFKFSDPDTQNYKVYQPSTDDSDTGDDN